MAARVRSRSERSVRREAGHWVGTFHAMASPCEVLMEVDGLREAERLLDVVCSEARRIERKFSRYRDDNLVHRINHAAGRSVEVDPETARLLDFAAHLFQVSDGRFDITSGALGKVWRFDGSDRLPDRAAVEEVLRDVGWGRASWDGREIRLTPGMQIDFGGIGKEYAVDRAASVVSESTDASCLINFGGDLRVTTPASDDRLWQVGIEAPAASTPGALHQVHLRAGGLATSGDSKRYLSRAGVRYGHILDPTTGWPVLGAPRSATVAAGSCIEAGMLATLAMLEGSGAEDFLREQSVRHWTVR